MDIYEMRENKNTLNDMNVTGEMKSVQMGEYRHMSQMNQSEGGHPDRRMNHQMNMNVNNGQIASNSGNDAGQPHLDRMFRGGNSSYNGMTNISVNSREFDMSVGTSSSNDITQVNAFGCEAMDKMSQSVMMGQGNWSQMSADGENMHRLSGQTTIEQKRELQQRELQRQHHQQQLLQQQQQHQKKLQQQQLAAMRMNGGNNAGTLKHQQMLLHQQQQQQMQHQQQMQQHQQQQQHMQQQQQYNLSQHSPQHLNQMSSSHNLMNYDGCMTQAVGPALHQSNIVGQQTNNSRRGASGGGVGGGVGGMMDASIYPQMMSSSLNGQSYLNQAGGGNRGGAGGASVPPGQGQDHMFGPSSSDMVSDQMLVSEADRSYDTLRRSLAPHLRQSILSGGHAVSVPSSRWDDRQQLTSRRQQVYSTFSLK